MTCAPVKNEVSEIDLKRLLETISRTRLYHHLSLEEGAIPKSERRIFLDSCKILRLNPILVLDKLKPKQPELYKLFKAKDE